MNKKIQSLFKLLDDEDPNAASLAMAELLTFDQELEPWLRNIQETENRRLRRRVHQLESILLTRRRRKNLPRDLKNTGFALIQRLFDLHMLWYDNDSFEIFQNQWLKLINKAKLYQPSSIDKLAYFMRKNGFAVNETDDFDADFFCVGIVLEELVGADFILCAIAQKVAEEFGLKTQIVKHLEKFGLWDEMGNVLFAKNDWSLLPQKKKGQLEVWTPTMILKHDAYMLFLLSICTDNFRYTYTIAKTLAKLDGHESLESLPYPFQIK